jgi:predicted dehydrogenase
MIKAAIIGLGKMGLSHVSIVNAHANAQVVAVCDISTLVLDAFRKFSDIRTYTDYVKLFDSETLDCVIIALPTRMHYPVVRLALERGIHVFCEKPFVLDEDECDELVKLAASKSLANQVGFHNNFIGTFIQLRKYIQGGLLGDLFRFSGTSYGPVVTNQKGNTWRSKPEEGGGCLYDYASHVINLVQTNVSHCVKVFGSLTEKYYSANVDDAVYALAELENGIRGAIIVNWSDETYRKMSTTIIVQGKKGKIVADATELKIYLTEENKKFGLPQGWTIQNIAELALPVNFYLRGEEYSAQIDYFIDCIINHKPTEINSFAESQSTDRVINMIIENSKILK